MAQDFYFTVANFIIMIILLYFVLRHSVQAFFRNRATNTRLKMDKVKKIYNETYRKYEEIEAKLKNADIEGKKLLEALKHEGELEKQRLIRKAREAAHQIKFEAERVVKQELTRAKEALRQETTCLAASLAKTRLVELLTAEDQKQLGEEFLANLHKLRRVS